MIIGDADFFIGLYLKRDLHHEACLKIAKKITDDILLSHDVIDEVMTKLSYFKRVDIAISFYENCKNSKSRIVYPNSVLVDKAVEILTLQKNSHVSLTDCLNIALAKEHGISHILSFDSIYTKNGLTLII